MDKTLLLFLSALGGISIIITCAKLFSELERPVPSNWDKIKLQGWLNVGYPLIIFLLCTVLTMCAQLGLGNLKYRLDISFFINSTGYALICVLIFYLFSEIKRLKHQLKNKHE